MKYNCIYFTSGVDANDRIRSLNEFNKINLNEMRRKSVQDDGVFNDCQYSDREFDDEVASIDSPQNSMNDDDDDDD